MSILFNSIAKNRLLRRVVAADETPARFPRSQRPASPRTPRVAPDFPLGFRVGIRRDEERGAGEIRGRSVFRLVGSRPPPPFVSSPRRTGSRIETRDGRRWLPPQNSQMVDYLSFASATIHSYRRFWRRRAREAGALPPTAAVSRRDFPLHPRSLSRGRRRARPV